MQSVLTEPNRFAKEEERKAIMHMISSDDVKMLELRSERDQRRIDLDDAKKELGRWEENMAAAEIWHKAATEIHSSLDSAISRLNQIENIPEVVKTREELQALTSQLSTTANTL